MTDCPVCHHEFVKRGICSFCHPKMCLGCLFMDRNMKGLLRAVKSAEARYNILLWKPDYYKGREGNRAAARDYWDYALEGYALLEHLGWIPPRGYIRGEGK